MRKIVVFAIFSMLLGSVWSGLAFAQAGGEEYFLQGNQLYNQKKYAEAVASYGRAIQNQPHTLPKAYLNCARAYSMQKDYVSSAQYYTFYAEVEPTAANDKKYKAEYKAVAKKARDESYVRTISQTNVLKQVEQSIAAGGPYWTRQGNGAMAYYDVLIRSGYAEPKLYTLQQQLIAGITTEIEHDIKPPAGQPLPNLDRTGWEFVRAKTAKARQFFDVQPDNARLAAIDALAYGWEAFYRGDYDEADKQFELACKSEPAMPAAYWGRVMLNFQRENNDVLLEQINIAEQVYQAAGVTNTTPLFALLRAQLYRNLGDMNKSIEWLSIMHGVL